MLRKSLDRLALALGLFAGLASADIVWNGVRVDAWPEEALHPVPAAGAFAARSAAVRVGKYPSPKGKVYGLTLLVDFPDNPAKFTKAEIGDWLNKEGFNRDGCKGSVRDYYLDVSNGQVDFTNEVFGTYRAKQTKAYYEKMTGYTGAAELLKEMLVYFDPLVDFSRYDNDKDGTTEAISIVYAGVALTWGQGLWPHAGWVGQTKDGTKLDRYQMTNMPGTYGLYTFVHECGHMVFGWPDLYWYGGYCTMGNHSNDLNPVAINDFFRADQGWIPFQDVTALDTAAATTVGDEKVYRYKNPERPDTEGFAWSFLQNTGRRSVVRGSGLLLHHYDFSITGNTGATKLGLRTIQADGLEELQSEQWPAKSTEGKDLFQAGTVASFDETRFPLLHWYDGNWSGLAVSGIGAPTTAGLAFRLGPALPAAAATTRLEAEKAQVVSGLVKTSGDASGGAYATSLDGPASKVVFTVHRPVAGRCSLRVRFANGGTRNASHSLSVNGSTDSVVYRPTGAWARFDSVARVVDLRQGRNQIVLARKTDLAELDAIALGAVFASAVAAGSPAVPSEVRLRRIAGGFVQAPAWMAGARLELLDPSGRSLGMTDLVASAEGAVARVPVGAGLLLWRGVRDGRVVAGGLLLP